MRYVVIIRGYEDRREQYSLIITASQWRFHHQSLSWPQITTFISCSAASMANAHTVRGESLMAFLSREVCTRWVINGDVRCVCFVTRVSLRHTAQCVCVRSIKRKTCRLSVQVCLCVAPAASDSEKTGNDEH